MRRRSSRKSSNFRPRFPIRSKSPRSTRKNLAHFADLVAVNLNLGLDERQTLLETTSVKERLTCLLPMLNREHEVLTLSSKIQTDVATSISKTQRDFFLREQMRAIQRELGESDPNAGEIRMLREKIEQTSLPVEAQEGGLAGTRSAAADASRGGRIRRDAQLSRMDPSSAVDQGNGRQDRFVAKPRKSSTNSISASPR